MSISTKPKVNVEIEYLRAVAVLYVLYEHLSGLLHWPPFDPPFYGADSRFLNLTRVVNGWSGVDLFFCISGFVISNSFIKTFDQFSRSGDPWIAMKAFWVRRFFRITPSAWTWIVVFLVCSIIFNRSETFFPFDRVLKSTIPILAYVANFAEVNGGIVPLGIYWSLALEEQFYFIFPFFLLFVQGQWRWKALLAIIFLLAFFDRNNFNSILWVTRVDALMWGVLIYFFSQTPQYATFEPTFCANRWAALGTSFMLVFLLGTVSVAWELNTVSMVAAISAVLVLIASYNKGYILPLPAPAPAFLLWVGSRSYAIYLVHMPAFYMAYESWFRVARFEGRVALDPSYTLRLLMTGAILVPILAELNYRVIEQPLRRRGAAIAKRILSTPNMQSGISVPSN